MVLHLPVLVQIAIIVSIASSVLQLALGKLTEWWMSGQRKQKIPPHLQKEFEASKKYWGTQYSRVDIENSINIAVVGVVNTGKSTLVNYLLGLQDMDKNAAETSVTPNTRITTPYIVNLNESKNVIVWDTPPTGTTSFPLRDYCEQHALFMFDCVLVVGDGTFSEVDWKLCSYYCHTHSIPFALVRSKMDEVYRNIKRKLQLPLKTRGGIAKEAISQIKKMYSAAIPVEMVDLSIPVFCISAHNGQDAFDDSKNLQPFEEKEMFTFIENGVKSRFTE